MDNIQLEDLVYTYPPYNVSGIQTLITAKEEFREVAGTVSESVPIRGQLYRQQKFLKRLMIQYDQQLVTWNAGVGKLCGYIAVTEYYKAIVDALEILRKNSLQPNTLLPPYKRAYILVKGQNLIDETKSQILCKCTDGDYITDQILNSKTETARKSNITRSISRFYTVTTYGTFAKTVFELTDEQLHIEFDNCIFIVDEVHNIGDDKTGGVLRTNDKGNKYYVHMEKKEGKMVEKTMESRLIYDQLWRLFHKAKPRKVMLLSATPMINDASELGPRLNLILPADHQIEIEDWNTVTLETLEPYFRGLISYVRALDTGAIPVYQGKVIQTEYALNPKDEDSPKVPAQIVVYATEMAEKQLKVYKQAVEDPESLRPESKNPAAFDDLKRQAANFIFPDDSTASVGYRKYVEEDKEQYRATPEFQRWLSDPVKFRSMSAKFYEIVRLCKTDPGNCWCYLDYIRGAGAIVLGLCFEYNGFERYNEGSSVFNAIGTGNLPPVCGAKPEDLLKNRTIRINKKLRYALLTSDNSSGPEGRSLLELFNSYENRHGEYIKVVIGSPVTRDGLNLANVLQIHLASAGWNQASSYQAESRAIRSTSHVDLIEEYKASHPEDLDPKIDIRVYRHAAVDENGMGVDIEMYELSEKKDREIKRIMRMMKQVSTDCQINYTRNVRPKDINGSANCDYDICAYKCYEPAPTSIDYTSYDVLYSQDVIEAIKYDIIDIFRVVFQLSFMDLYNELDYNKKFIDLAVTDLIENKIVIMNRYGYKSYLREDQGVLFLRHDFPLKILEKKGAIALSEYNEYLIGTEKITLNEYNGIIQRGTGDLLEKLEDLSEDEMEEIINNYTLENRILLLEEAIKKYYIDSIQDEVETFILNKFRNSIFFSFEPLNALEYTKNSMESRAKGRGRPKKKESKFRFKPEQEKEIIKLIEKPNSKEVIYIHNLASKKAQTSYHKKEEGTIRLYKASENIGWRDANEIEDIVYSELIKVKNKKNKVEFDIYGTIEDGKFKIIDKTTENLKAQVDRRSAKKGRICDTWKRDELIDLLWKLRHNPFTININLTEEQLIIFLKNEGIDASEFDEDQLQFYYAWYKSGANRNKICELLQEFLDENDLLFRV